jgi:hypothetical protein
VHRIEKVGCPYFISHDRRDSTIVERHQEISYFFTSLLVWTSQFSIQTDENKSAEIQEFWAPIAMGFRPTILNNQFA